MPDVLLFGATGYTGRLTGRALVRRRASFAVAGRDRAKLEALAAELGGVEVRVARVGDVDGLGRALEGVRVLLTCVGPFTELGDTAVEAALRAGAHYVDATGEGEFVARLIAERDEPARARGIALAPCMGFDEVPADVAATLAVEGLERPQVVVTYAVRGRFSHGTLRSLLGILAAQDGWGGSPRPGCVACPFAVRHLAPLHLELASLETYLVGGRGARIGVSTARALASSPRARRVLERLVPGGGPNERARAASRWTIVAQAHAGSERRRVELGGRDGYGLTAELLAAAAMRLTEEGYDRAGVLAPVQAVGLETLRKELTDWGVAFR